jgi:hypothetical protein
MTGVQCFEGDGVARDQREYHSWQQGVVEWTKVRLKALSHSRKVTNEEGCRHAVHYDRFRKLHQDVIAKPTYETLAVLEHMLNSEAGRNVFLFQVAIQRDPWTSGIKALFQHHSVIPQDLKPCHGKVRQLLEPSEVAGGVP